MIDTRTPTAIREDAFEAFDATWSEQHNRPKATYGGARMTFFEAGYRHAMDTVVAARTDLDAMRSELAALEDHANVEGGCQRQMFLGNCAECDQYGRLTERVVVLQAEQPGLEPRDGFVIRTCDSPPCGDEFYAAPDDDSEYCPPCVFESIRLKQAAG